MLWVSQDQIFRKTEYKFSASGLFLKTIFNPSFYRKAFFSQYENVCSLQIRKITASAFLIQDSSKERKNKIIGRIQAKNENNSKS